MLHVLKIRGFLPFVVMIFLNAFVDLGHKIVIQNTVFKIYDGHIQIVLTAIVNGLILLPFILLFTPSGFLSDRFNKPGIMRWTAAGAVVLTLMITLCYYNGWFELAFIMTFLLAIQSAFYSPAKYGYIRESVGKDFLASANGIVQATTIVAILSGVFFFSILFETFLKGQQYDSEQQIIRLIAPISWVLVASSVIEWIASLRIPVVVEGDRGKTFDINKYRKGHYLRQNLGTIYGHKGIWLSIVGLSLFWSVSQVVLAAFPAFAKETLQITNTIVVQGLLACSGIGIVIGSLLAGRLSKNYIETGLIPIAAFGMVFTLALIPVLDNLYLMALTIIGFGLFGGLFIVPLNSLIQFHAGKHQLGMVLAGNNWFQNVVMFVFLVITGLSAWAGLGSVNLLNGLAVFAFVAAVFIMVNLPQSLIRYSLGLWFNIRFSIEVKGFHHLPSQGGVLLLGKQVNDWDWALLQIACPRRLKFIMNQNTQRSWMLNRFIAFFNIIKLVPSNHPQTLPSIRKMLVQGQMVCPLLNDSRNNTDHVDRHTQEYVAMLAPAKATITPFEITVLNENGVACSMNELQNRNRFWRRYQLIVSFGESMPDSTDTESVEAAFESVK